MKPFHYFEDPAVTELASRINAAGAGARLEVRTDAHNHMTLRVVPRAAAAQGESLAADAWPDDINSSHTCPPDCP